jgi:hypothetical protein
VVKKCPKPVSQDKPKQDNNKRQVPQLQDTDSDLEAADDYPAPPEKLNLLTTTTTNQHQPRTPTSSKRTPEPITPASSKRTPEPDTPTSSRPTPESSQVPLSPRASTSYTERTKDVLSSKKFILPKAAVYCLIFWVNYFSVKQR